MFARYQHIFTILEADSELSGMCYGKPSSHSTSIIVVESNMIFTTLLMHNGYCDCACFYCYIMTS